jgi:hypothetical protein
MSVPAIETISFSAQITNHLSDPFISNRVDLADAQNKDGVLRFLDFTGDVGTKATQIQCP